MCIYIDVYLYSVYSYPEIPGISPTFNSLDFFSYGGWRQFIIQSVRLDACVDCNDI